jgi:GDP-4-dehydro-6-deoxy-D-mannose reductase
VRILITGARGFVASYLRDALLACFGKDLELIATAKESARHPKHGELAALDVTDPSSVAQAIKLYVPTHVIHLAGIAAPSIGNLCPHLLWRVHLHGTLNVAETILNQHPDCWLFYVGSALVYGNTARSCSALDEEKLLSPIDDYGASKAAADLALGAMTYRGLKCVRFRPFNHTGPGQADGFVLPDFAAQIAKIEAGLAPPVMEVGNLDVERDFLDVGDVVDAYTLAIQKTKSLRSGTVFNIASGVPRRVGDVLEQLLIQSRAKIEVRLDPKRLRSTDLPRLVGNAERARNCLAWTPTRQFEETIVSILNDWRARSSNRPENAKQTGG